MTAGFHSTSPKQNVCQTIDKSSLSTIQTHSVIHRINSRKPIHLQTEYINIAVTVLNNRPTTIVQVILFKWIMFSFFSKYKLVVARRKIVKLSLPLRIK